MKDIKNEVKLMELEYNLICDFIKLRNELGLTQKILAPFGYTLSITKIKEEENESR